MKRVEFNINLKKEGTLRELFKLFKDEPVIDWLLTNKKASISPMNYIYEAVEQLSSDNDVDVPYVLNGDIICETRALSARGVFKPKSGIQPWGIDFNTTGAMCVTIRCHAEIDSAGRIVSIGGYPILERLLNSLQDTPVLDAPKWETSVTYQNMRTLKGVSDNVSGLILTNLVEGAISMDPRSNYPAIVYLLLGYTCKYLARDYITESVIRAQRTGLISTYPKIFME